MEKELKAAIKGLERDGFDHTELWYKLVGELISLYELDENTEAIRFWNNK